MCCAHRVCFLQGGGGGSRKGGEGEDIQSPSHLHILAHADQSVCEITRASVVG